MFGGGRICIGPGGEPPAPLTTENTMDMTFKKSEVYQGVHTWNILIDGQIVGEMEKWKPSRYHGGGASGMVQNRKAPWSWSAWVTPSDNADTIHIDIPDGLTASEARRLIKAAVC